MNITYIRVAVMALITGLSAAINYYPEQHWISVLLAVLGVVSASVIPSIEQTRVSSLPVSNPNPKPFTGEYK